MYGAHCAQIKHQCEHTLENDNLGGNSLRWGALQVELLKMDLHPLIGKCPESSFCEEFGRHRVQLLLPEGKCALADMSLWI